MVYAPIDEPKFYLRLMFSVNDYDSDYRDNSDPDEDLYVNVAYYLPLTDPICSSQTVPSTSPSGAAE